MNGYDAVRCSLTLSSIKFTRFNVENKLHFPCIQYVTTKVTIFMENAKHLTYAVLLQIQISPKQSCQTRVKQMENKLCSLHIGIVGFVLDFTPA